MERRALLMSLGLSSLAMYMVYQYISGVDSELSAKYGSLSPMVVATRDILQFQTIRPSDMEVVQVPQAMVPPGRVSDPKHAIDAVAAVPISRGEQILDNKVISKNVYSGLDTQVSLGRRAISIPVTVKSSLGYLLRPGNRVDLAAHFEYKSTGTSISEVKVFLQDLLVLAVGKTIQSEAPKAVDQNLLKSLERGLTGTDNPDKVSEKVVEETLNFAKTDTNFTTITLEVTPRQAQTIVYVMSVFPDSIVALLRHSDDRQVERRSRPTTTLRDVMGDDSYFGRGPKAPPMRTYVMPKFRDMVSGQEIPPQ